MIRKSEKQIKRITLIAPSFDLKDAFENILRLVRKDFEAEQFRSEASALEIAESLQSSRTFYDGPMKKRLTLAATDPNFFTYYCCNADQMGQFFGFWSEHQKAFDLQSFERVLMSLDKLQLASTQDFFEPLIKMKDVNIFWGKEDPIARKGTAVHLLAATGHLHP